MTDTIKLDELLAAVKDLPAEKIPQHVAIIMDGNGRWANARNLHRTEGHKAGVASVKRLVKFAPIVGVKMLTLYTFSTENWTRPQFEVRTLMSLLSESTMRELDELVANDVKLTVSGKIEELPTAQ